jgi:acyl carrier protein
MKSTILTILKSVAPESDFDGSQNFLDDGLLDSFDVILVTTALEEQFGIAIPGEQISPENYHSLESLSGLVMRCSQSEPS